MKMGFIMAYTKGFYEHNRKVTETTAQIIAKLMMGIVKPKSVVDVGCASGLFLHEFEKKGCDILGIDYHSGPLLIPKEKYIQTDFTQGFPSVSRKFDLTICLETAEHLDEKYADALVRYLTELSDVVLFGAAIPAQTGTHHVNEQWQSYWAQKFAEKGYVYIDCIRQKLWGNNNVINCYRQNDLLYVKKSLVGKYRKYDMPMPLNVVHPSYWELNSNPKTMFLPHIATAIKALPYLPKRYLGRKKVKFEN